MEIEEFQLIECSLLPDGNYGVGYIINNKRKEKMSKFTIPSPGDKVKISAMPQLGIFIVKSVYLSGGYPACKLDGQTGKHSRFIDELEPYIESEQDDDPLLQVN